MLVLLAASAAQTHAKHGRMQGRPGWLLQGNLLDDKELIDVLAVTKATSAEVTERLKGASETEIKIKDACEEFRPVAHRATLLYFLIAEFSTVNCMYQTSLAQVSPGHCCCWPFESRMAVYPGWLGSR